MFIQPVNYFSPHLVRARGRVDRMKLMLMSSGTKLLRTFWSPASRWLIPRTYGWFQRR